MMKTISNSFTVTVVEDAPLYYIQATPSEVFIASDEATAQFSLSLKFQKKDSATLEWYDYPCHYAVLRFRANGTYSVAASSSTKVSSTTTGTINVSSNPSSGDYAGHFLVVIADDPIDANRQGELFNETINVVKHGDTGGSGENAIRVDLDNENDSMLYTSGGTLVSGNVVSHATLYDGMAPYTTSGVTWAISSEGCTATISGNTITVTAMSASSAKVTVTATYNGSTYTAVLTLKKLVDMDKYEVIVEPNSIAYNATTDTPATSSITATCYKTSVDGTRVVSTPPSGYYIGIAGIKRSDGTSSTLVYAQTSSVSVGSPDADNSLYKEYVAYIGNRSLLRNVTSFYDRETIPVNTSENGENVIRVDLDNENDSMLYTSGGTLVSGNVVSRATLYDGTTPQADSLGIS